MKRDVISGPQSAIFIDAMVGPLGTAAQPVGWSIELERSSEIRPLIRRGCRELRKFVRDAGYSKVRNVQVFEAHSRYGIH